MCYNRDNDSRDGIDMLIRFIMAVFLLAVSMMPAWANGNDVSDDWKEYFRQKYYQRIIESPLSKLTVMTKDWRDGNTYYVCHTITNPTNERIEKKLTRIQVSYYTHNPNITNSYHQYVDAITALVIEPNETVTITLPLLIPSNDTIDTIEYQSTLFEFTDRSFIDVPMAPSPASIHISPIFSPTGDLAISVQNSTFDTTITEMRDINLSA